MRDDEAVERSSSNESYDLKAVSRSLSLGMDGGGAIDVIATTRREGGVEKIESETRHSTGG